MDTVTALQGATAFAHRVTLGTIAGLPEEMVNLWPEGGKVNSIGVTLAHAVLSEDEMIQRVCRDTTPLYKQAEWADRIGVPVFHDPDAGIDWATVRVERDRFLPYVNAVFAATDRYLGSVSVAECGREVDSGFAGMMPLGRFYTVAVLYHLMEHTGEISALKGMRGMKGLPF